MQQTTQPGPTSKATARKCKERSPQRTVINMANTANVGVLLGPLKYIRRHAPASNERVTAPALMRHRG